jgi:accessory Sec system S-layer assembly protein
MLSIFKKKDPLINSNDGLKNNIKKHSTDDFEDTDVISTELSFYPEQELNIQEKYIFQYHHAQLKPLDKNQISISAYQLNKYDNYFVVHAFISSTLEKPVILSNVTLLLLDENKKKLAKKDFNLEELGELPPKSSRPWIFIFQNEDAIAEIPHSGWQLAFEISKQQNNTPLEFHDNSESSYSEEQKHFLQKLVKDLPPIQKGELNIMGIEALQAENQDLYITLLFRNGSAKNIQLQQLPLQITNGDNVLITEGIFNLDSFEIKANTAKPWRFIFPAALLADKNPDLSTWKVSVKNHN